ncbi:MAG: hypothetical protein HQ538_01395 [Parcubacteria group bacterium]|nr:hypothetical protein [Parcubacteria group bacterium]
MKNVILFTLVLFTGLIYVFFYNNLVLEDHEKELFSLKQSVGFFPYSLSLQLKTSSQRRCFIRTRYELKDKDANIKVYLNNVLLEKTHEKIRGSRISSDYTTPYNSVNKGENIVKITSDKKRLDYFRLYVKNYHKRKCRANVFYLLKPAGFSLSYPQLEVMQFFTLILIWLILTILIYSFIDLGFYSIGKYNLLCFYPGLLLCLFLSGVSFFSNHPIKLSKYFFQAVFYASFFISECLVISRVFLTAYRGKHLRKVKIILFFLCITLPLFFLIMCLRYWLLKLFIILTVCILSIYLIKIYTFLRRYSMLTLCRLSSRLLSLARGFSAKFLISFFFVFLLSQLAAGLLSLAAGFSAILDFGSPLPSPAYVLNISMLIGVVLVLMNLIVRLVSFYKEKSKKL